MKFELKKENINEFLKVLNKIMNIGINIIYYDELNYYYSYEINELNEFMKNNNLNNNDVTIEFIIYDNIQHKNKLINDELNDIELLNKFNIDHHVIDVIENEIIIELFDPYEINIYELNEKINDYYYKIHTTTFNSYYSYYNNKKTINKKRKKTTNIFSGSNIFNKLLNYKYSFKSIKKLNNL